MEFSAKFLLEKSAAERRKEATSPLCEKCGVRHLDDGISCPIIDIRYILDFSNNSVFHSQVFLGLRECILQLNVDPQLILFKKEFLLNFVEKTSMRSLLKMSLCKEVMSLYEQIVASPLIPVINSFSDLILISVFSKFIHSLLKYPRESLKKMLRKQSMEEDDAQYSPDISGIIIYHLFLAVMRQCHIHNNNLTDRINLFDWTDFVKTVKVKTPVFNMNLNKLEMPFHISTDTLMEFVHPYKHMPHLTLKEPGVLVITESGLSWVDSNWITYPVPIEVYLRRAEKKSSIAVHMAAKNICKNICSSSSGAVPEMYAVKMTKIEHDRVLKTMRAAFNKVVRDSNVKWIEDKRRISNSLILPRTQMQPPFGFRNWSQLTGRKQTRKSNIYARQIIADEFVNIMNSSQLGNESCFGEMIEYALDEIALFLNGRVYGSYKLAQDQDEKNYLVIEPSLPSANEPNEILDMDVLTNNSNVFYDNEGNHMLIPKEETVENTCSLSDDSEEEQENNTSLQDDNADFMILTPDNETGSLLSFENNYNDAQNSDSFLNGNIDSHSTSSALSDVPSDDISITESVTTQEEPSDYQLSFAYNIFNHDIYDQALRHHPELFPPIHLPICFIRSMDARGFREPKLERTVPFSPFFLTFPHCCLHLFCFHYNGLYKLYVGRSYLAIHKKKVVYIAKAPYYVARSFSLDDLSESDVESQSDDDGSESFESAGLPSPKSDEAETDAEDESYEDEAHENFLQPNEQLSNDSIKMLRVEMRNNMLIFKNLGFYEHIKLYLGDNQAAELRKGPLPYFLNENRCAEDDLNSWNGIYISRIMNNVHSSQLKFDSLRENGMIPQFLSDVSMHTQEVMCDSSGNILSETDSELSTLTLSRPSFRHTVSYHTKLTYNRLMIRPSTFGFRSTHDRNGNSLSFMGFPPTEPVELNQPSSQPFESQFVANQHILPPHSAQSIISGTSSEYNSPLQTDQAPMQPVPSDVEMRLIQNWNSLSFMGFPTIQLIHANLPYSHPFESQSVANQHILPPHSAESIISGTSSGYNPPVRADQAFMQPVPSDVEISINQNRNPQSIMGLSPIEPVELNLPSSQPFESQPVANQHILPPHSAESIISGTSSGYNPPVRADQAFMQPVPSDVEMRLNQNEYPLSFMGGAPIEPVDLNLPSSQRFESQSVANQHILPPHSAESIISGTSSEYNSPLQTDQASMQPVPSDVEMRLNQNEYPLSFMSGAPIEPVDLNLPSSQRLESRSVANQHILPPRSAQNIISFTIPENNTSIWYDEADPSVLEIRLNVDGNIVSYTSYAPMEAEELNMPSSQPFESQPVPNQPITPHSTQNIISGTSLGYNPPVRADQAFMQPVPSDVEIRINQNRNPQLIMGSPPIQPVELNLPSSQPFESQPVATQHILPPHSTQNIISGTSSGYNPPVWADHAFMPPAPSNVGMRLNQNGNPLSIRGFSPLQLVDLNLPFSHPLESQTVANQHLLPPHSAESIISGTSLGYNPPVQADQAFIQPVPSDVEMRLNQNRNPLSFMSGAPIEPVDLNLPSAPQFESQSVANQHILPPHSAESIISGTSSEYNSPLQTAQASMQPVPSDVEMRLIQNWNSLSFMGFPTIQLIHANLPYSHPFESQSVANQHILPPHSAESIISGTSSGYNPPVRDDQAFMQPVPSDVEISINQNRNPQSIMGLSPIEPVELNLPSSQPFESQHVANQHILPPHSTQNIISGTSSRYNPPLQTDQASMQPVPSDVEMRLNQNEYPLSFMGGAPIEPVDLNLPSSQRFESQSVANQHILPPHSAESIISGTTSEYNSPLQTDQASMQPVPSDVEMRLNQNGNPLSIMSGAPIEPVDLNLPSAPQFESQSVANQHILPPHSAESIISGTSSEYNSPLQTDQAFMQPVPSDVEMRLNQNENPLSIMSGAPIEPVDLNLPSAPQFESQSVANQHILPPHSAESIISGTSSEYNSPLQTAQASMQPVPSDVEMRLIQNWNSLSFMGFPTIQLVPANLPYSHPFESQSVANQHILPPHSAQSIISGTSSEYNPPLQTDQASMQPVPSDVEMRLNQNENPLSFMSGAPIEPVDLNLPSAPQFESQSVANQHILPPHSAESIISGTSSEYNSPLQTDQAFMQPVPSDVEMRLNQNENPLSFMSGAPIEPVDLNLPSAPQFESQSVANQHILPPHSAESIISGTSSEYNSPLQTAQASMQPVPSDVEMRLNQNRNPQSFVAYPPIDPVELNLPSSQPFESEPVANQHILPPHSAESFISGRSSEYNSPLQTAQASMQPVPSDVEMRLNQNENPLSFMSGAPIEPVDLNLPSAPQFESQSVANQHILPPHSAESIISGTSSEYNSPLQTAQASMQPVPSDVEMRLNQNRNPQSFVAYPPIDPVELNLPSSQPFESEPVANQHILPPHSAESFISGRSSEYNSPLQTAQASMQPVPSDVEMRLNQNENPLSFMSGAPIEPVDLNLPSAPQFESQSVANQHILPPHSAESIISGTSSEYNSPLQTAQASMQPVPSDVEMRFIQNWNSLSFMGFPTIQLVPANLPYSHPFESQSVANQHILPPHSAQSIISGTSSEYNPPLQTDQASMQPVPSDVEMRLNQNENPLSFMSGAPIEPVDLNLPSAPQFESQSVANQHILPPHSAESIISGTSSEYNSPLQTDQAFMQPVPSDVEMRLNQNENPLSFMGFPPIDPVELNLPSSQPFESQSVANQHLLPPHSAESIISGTSSEYNSPLQIDQAFMQPVPSDVEMRLNQSENPLSFRGGAPIEPVDLNLPSSQRFESQSVANQNILLPHSAQSIISGTSSGYNPPVRADQAFMQPVPSDVEMRINPNGNPLSFIGFPPIEPVELNLPSAPQFESQSVANQHILPPHSAESFISGTSSEYNSPLQTAQASMQPVPSDVEMRLNQNENPLSFMGGAPIEPVDLNLPSSQRFESQSLANQHILPPHRVRLIMSDTISGYDTSLWVDEVDPSVFELRISRNGNLVSFMRYAPLRQGVQDSSSSTQLGTVHIEQTFSTQNIPYDRNTEYDDSPDEPLIQSKTFVRRVEYIQIMNQQATEGDSLALAEQNKIELNETPQSTAPTFQQDSVISFNMLSSSRQNNSDDQSDNGENVNQMLIDHESPESAQQPFESINHQLILNDQPTSPPVELVRSPVDGVNYDPVIDPQSQIPFMNPVEDVSQFSDSEITGTRKMSTSQQQQLPMNSSVSPRGSKRSPGQTDTIPAKKRCSEQFLQRNSPTESNNISSGRTNTENYEDIVYLFSQRSSDSPEEVIEISFPIDHSIIHHETFRAGLSLEKLEEFRKLQMMAILRASFTDTFVRFFTEILNTIGRIHVLPTNADSLQRACRIIKKVVETTKPCLLMDAYIQLPKKLKQLLDRTVVPPTLRDYSPVNPLEMTYKQRWLYYFQLPNATGTAPITTKMIAAYMSKVHIDTFKTSLPIHNPPLSVIFELINDHFDLLTVEFMNSDMSQEASEWLEQRQSEHRQFETNLWYIIGKNKQ